MENISEFYYKNLVPSTTPAVILLQYYSAISDTQGGRSEIIKLNKLIKLFGRFRVFFALMALANSRATLGVDDQFPFGLLFKICRDEIEKQADAESAAVASRDLGKDISMLQKEISRTSAVVIDEKTLKALE